MDEHERFSHVTVASSSGLRERVEPLGVWRRRRCRHTRRRSSFRRCPESPMIDICRSETKETHADGRTTNESQRLVTAVSDQDC